MIQDSVQDQKKRLADTAQLLLLSNTVFTGQVPELFIYFAYPVYNENFKVQAVIQTPF